MSHDNTLSDLPEVEKTRRRHRKRRPCGKRRYYSKDSAKLALSNAASKNNARRQESRFYWCYMCHAYHLSSQPRRRHADRG